MSKLLLSDALAKLDPAVLPAVPSEQLLQINGCLSTFFSDGQWARTTTKWKGISTAASFAIQFDACGGAFFTLPRNFLCLMAGAAYQNNQAPGSNWRVLFSKAPIQGMWHQYGNSGPGVEDRQWQRGLQDMGDGFTTFADIAAPSYLRVITETTETNPTNVLFRGKDQNDNEIFSGSGGSTTIGCSLNIGAATTTQTTQIFGSTPYTVSKPVTNGPINLYAVNVATGVATLIAVYQPGETSPGYRRYSIGGAGLTVGTPGGSTNFPYVSVQTIVKRRFVEVVQPSDEIIPGLLPALTQGLMAWQYDLERDPRTADIYWENAIQLLNSELIQFNGAATPQVIWQRDSGLARIPSLF